MRKLIFTFLTLLFGFNLANSQQYPITVIPQVNSPAPVYFHNYADPSTLNSPLRVQLLFNDITVVNEQVRLKVYFEGSGISFESRDLVIGASPLFISGGTPVTLSNQELAPYFELQNLQGINSNIYSSVIPEGSYQFCFEIYDFSTGNKLSAKSCSNIYIFKNEPPLLNLPLNQINIEPSEVENIVFQWTPRHINVSNVEYELSIVEIWDDSVSPETAFLSSVPFFQTTTRSTSFIYGPSQPLLLSGKRYAWRIKAKALLGAEEIGLFRNEGNSEIYWFSRTEPCAPPLNIYAEAKGTSKFNVFWEEDPSLYSEYKIAYREANDPDAEWFNIQTNSSWATIWHLKPGTTYEYKVSGKCKFMESDFSETQEITTTIEEDKSADYNCGIVPERVAISNQEPHPGLNIGDGITAGTFVVILTEINSQRNGIISGKGFVKIPYLNYVRLAVNFDNILVNTNNQLAQGEIVTVYDENFGEGEQIVIDLEIHPIEIITGDQGEIATATVDYYILSIEQNENGAWVITGTNGEQGILPGGEDVLLTDANGDTYQISEDGIITSGNIASGGAISESISEIEDIGVTVTFKASGIYSFDKLSNELSSSLTAEYPTLEFGNQEYLVPYKAISKLNGDDIIKATVTFSDDTSYTKEDIIFKTKEGVSIPFNWNENGDEVTLTLIQAYDYAIEDIVATVFSKNESNKQLVIGSFKLVHLGAKLSNIELVIVPINNVNIESNIKTTINEIYNKAGVNFNISIADTLEVSQEIWDQNTNNTLDVGDSSLLTYYTDEENAILKHFKTQPAYEAGKYYIFLSDLPVSNIKTDGFMPLKGQFGFVFNTQNQGKIAAHELGHGVFGLEHPFKTYGIPEKSTDFLMDYKKGTNLSHMDWKKMHAPGLELYLFQNDDDGALYSTEYTTATNILKLIRCAYNNGNTDIGQELKDELTSLRKQIADEYYNLASRTATLIVQNEGEFKSASIDVSINTNTEILKFNTLPNVDYSKTNDDTYMFDLGDITVSINTSSLKKLFDSEDPEKFKNYITVQQEYADSQPLLNYVTSLLVDDDLSNSDIEFLKTMTNCELEELSHQIRFKIIELLSNKWTLFEERENLILNLLQSTPVSSYDILLLNLQNNPEIYKTVFERIDAGDNDKAFLNEVYTIWSGSEYYNDPKYHIEDSGNYNPNIRDVAFYREFQKEIASFIYGETELACLSEIKNLSAKELNICISNATSNNILSLSLEDRKFIIEKFLENPTFVDDSEYNVVTGGDFGFQQSIVRLIKLIPDSVNKDDFMKYLSTELVTTTITYGTQQATSSEETIVHTLFSSTNDSGFLKGSNDYRKELIEGFQNLKLKSDSFKTEMATIYKDIENFDADALQKSRVLFYQNDYQNILERLWSDVNVFDFPDKDEDFYYSLETSLSKGVDPKVSITQKRRYGLLTSGTFIEEKKFDPFALILLINTAKLPTLYSFSETNANNEPIASYAPAILAHYATTVGDEQTESDTLFTILDVGSLFLPGGQLTTLGKMFYRLDKISSLASIAATYNRQENEDLANAFNMLSLATGVISLGDLFTGDTPKQILKNNATAIKNATPSEQASNLQEAATNFINVAENHTDQLDNYVASSKIEGDNVEVIEEIFQEAKTELGEVLSSSQIAKVDEAITALSNYRTTTKATNYRFEELGYTYDPLIQIDEFGEIDFFHYLKKGDETLKQGNTTITKDGMLVNRFNITPDLRGQEISKAIAARILEEDVKYIKSSYPSSNDAYKDNYIAFMKIYNVDKNNLEEAILATPDGKVFGGIHGWEPTQIEIKESGVDAIWIKPGTTIPRIIEYEFEKLGYYYKLESNNNVDGTTEIFHYLKKEGEEYKRFGNSNITSNGTMDENIVTIPKEIENLDVLDAVYKKLLTGDNEIKKIESEYVSEPGFADDYNAFMSAYNSDKNNFSEAALATSEGKVLGSDWEPTNLKFNDYGITLTWIKKSDMVTDAPSSSYKKLSDDIEYKYEDPNGEFLDTSLQEIHESIQQLIKESELPDFVKIELAKAEDYHSLQKLIGGHSETFFNIITSSNTELAEYAMFLVKEFKEELFDYKTYQYLISESEKVFKLTTVTGTLKANRSGYNGALYNGELNGKKTIFKYDIGNAENAINKMEEILINLSPYGGPEFYGRYKIQIEDGTWREVVAMESIDGVDIKTITESNLDDVTSFKVTETHLKGIDNIEEQLRTNGNILIDDVNFGDFILTNDPNRPVVLIDISLKPGTALHQGLITTSGAKQPVRETIEELIEAQKKITIPTTNPIKYEFEELGYIYEPTISTNSAGTTTFNHYLKKEGEEDIRLGVSFINKDGELENTFRIEEVELRKKEISKAIILRLLEEDISYISSSYPSTNSKFFDNFIEFMKVYNPSLNNDVEAALATPSGKVLGGIHGWTPTEINIIDSGVNVRWVKKIEDTLELRTKQLIEKIRATRPNCK